MPTLIDKPQAVDLLRNQFQALAALCSDLTEDQWDRPTCLPGWTVRDVLSHIIGAEAMLLGEQAPVADISGIQHIKNPIAEANELWVQSMRDHNGEQMRARFTDVTARRLAALSDDPGRFRCPVVDAGGPG